MKKPLQLSYCSDPFTYSFPLITSNGVPKWINEKKSEDSCCLQESRLKKSQRQSTILHELILRVNNSVTKLKI